MLQNVQRFYIFLRKTVYLPPVQVFYVKNHPCPSVQEGPLMGTGKIVRDSGEVALRLQVQYRFYLLLNKSSNRQPEASIWPLHSAINFFTCFRDLFLPADGLNLGRGVCETNIFSLSR